MFEYIKSIFEKPHYMVTLTDILALALVVIGFVVIVTCVWLGISAITDKIVEKIRENGADDKSIKKKSKGRNNG